MYEVNLDSKTTNTVGMPNDITFDRPLVVPDGINNQTNLFLRGLTDRQARISVPSTGFW